MNLPINGMEEEIHHRSRLSGWHDCQDDSSSHFSVLVFFTVTVNSSNTMLYTTNISTSYDVLQCKVLCGCWW